MAYRPVRQLEPRPFSALALRGDERTTCQTFAECSPPVTGEPAEQSKLQRETAHAGFVIGISPERQPAALSSRANLLLNAERSGALREQTSTGSEHGVTRETRGAALIRSHDVRWRREMILRIIRGNLSVILWTRHVDSPARTRNAVQCSVGAIYRGSLHGVNGS